MAVIQRLQNNNSSGGSDSLLTDEELKQLQQKKLGESKKWQEIEIDPVLRSKIKTG